MKYLKYYENMNIDPFSEEDWDEVEVELDKINLDNVVVIRLIRGRCHISKIESIIEDYDEEGIFYIIKTRDQQGYGSIYVSPLFIQNFIKNGVAIEGSIMVIDKNSENFQENLELIEENCKEHFKRYIDMIKKELDYSIEKYDPIRIDRTNFLYKKNIKNCEKELREFKKPDIKKMIMEI